MRVRPTAKICRSPRAAWRKRQARRGTKPESSYSGILPRLGLSSKAPGGAGATREERLANDVRSYRSALRRGPHRMRHRCRDRGASGAVPNRTELARLRGGGDSHRSDDARLAHARTGVLATNGTARRVRRSRKHAGLQRGKLALGRVQSRRKPQNTRAGNPFLHVYWNLGRQRFDLNLDLLAGRWRRSRCPVEPYLALSRLRLPGDGRRRARRPGLAARDGRLSLLGLHYLDRIQPDRSDAADAAC